MARRRASVTAMLNDQAKTKSLAPHSTTNLTADIKNAHGRVDFSSLPLLGHDGISDTYNLSFLLDFPNLCEPLIEAFKRRALSVRSSSMASFVRQLRRGYFTFLREENLLGIALSQINREVWMAFITWLDKQRTGCEPLSPLTRRQHLRAAILLFEHLATVPRWTAQVDQIVVAAPRGAYPGAEYAINSRQRLDRDRLLAIKRAAEDDICAIVQRFDEGERLLAEGRAKLASGARNYRQDFAVCFAALVRRYPTLIPTKHDLKRDLLHPGTNGSLLYYAARDHTFERFHAYLYPSSDDMVPFALLIAIFTVLNAEELLTMQLKEVRLIELFGEKFVRIVVFKARSKKNQTKLVPAGNIHEMGPLYMFHHLRRVTKTLRKKADHHKNNLLIFRQQTGNREITGFGSSRKLTATVGAFDQALRRFCKKWSIPEFNISQIRTTIADEFHEAYGIFATAEILGHKSASTTRRSYTTSDKTRNRNQLHIGKIQALRERWAQTKGTIDPRRNSRGHLGKGSATPGFDCADPFNSPREAQKGRSGICQLYGECPVCPLSMPYPDDPLAAALYVGLLDAIFRAAWGHVEGSAWIKKWAPIAQALANLIATIPASVMAQRPDLPAPLPPPG